jgi:hypothetical protein
VNIGVPLQYQEMTEWCWLACAARRALLQPREHGDSGGHGHGNRAAAEQFRSGELRAYPGDIQNNPGLAGRFANAFSPAADLCLDNVGLPQVRHQTGGIGKH